MKAKKIGKLILIATIVIALSIAGFAFWRYNKAKEAKIVLAVPEDIEADKEFNIPVRIDTGGKSINAAEIYLKFDPARLDVISVSKDNSIFTLWITGEPKFSNDRGEVSFAGGLPTPGFSGVGQIGQIKAKAKKSGEITIEFDSKSRALSNDGVGTEIKLQLDPIKFKVGK